MSRRRSKGPGMVVIWWRDIPAQVTATDGTNSGKALLPDRFQHAIDRAAAVADLTDTDSYVAEWRRVNEPLTSDPSDAATERAADLDQSHPRERLEALVANGGLTPDAEQP